MRLIDADAMTTHIDFIIPRMLPDKNNGKHYISLETIREWIDEAPTVEAEPIIRCKDCTYSFCNDFVYKGSYECDLSDRIVDQNDYCNYAERKE